MEKVNLKNYIKENSILYFCDIELFEFGRADESISICKAEKDCHKNFEEFILQSFLVMMNEYMFSKREKLGVNIGKLHSLENFLFERDWKEEYELIPMDISEVQTLLSKWIDSKTMAEMNLVLSDINLAIILNEFDSMEQYVTFDTCCYKYLLVRSLG